MPFDVDRFTKECRDAHAELGSPLTYLAVTGSTNDDALHAARLGATHGALFVADEQTRGRGRRGNTWHAAPGESLLFSLLLRPKLAISEISALTLAIGLALRDAIGPRLATPLKIKWPNDLYAGDKKLAGVLVESQMQGEQLQAVVIGVGLNVTTRSFPAEIAARATSLALSGAEPLEREGLLVHLLIAIGRRVAAYERSGVRGILDELNAADALRGKAIRVDAQRGIGRGVDGQGQLVLETEAGALISILSGTVELL